MTYTFRGCEEFNQNINNWDVSNVTNFSYMFSTAKKFNQPLSGWSTTSAINMRGMFAGGFQNKPSGSFNQDISSWDVSNVTSFQYMFYNQPQFNQPLSTWDTSSATNMSYMFGRSLSFNQNIDSWDVSNVTNFEWMFAQDYEATPTQFNQPLSGWNTSSATNMRGMFMLSQFNQSIDSWDVSNVFRFTKMFNGAVSFNQSISNWNTISARFMDDMFYNATSFNQALHFLDITAVASGHNFRNFVRGTNLSTENYSKMLISFGNQVAILAGPSGCTMNNGNIITYNCTDYDGNPYINAVPARAFLVSTGWNITDGGLDPGCTVTLTPTVTNTPTPTNTPTTTLTPTTTSTPGLSPDITNTPTITPTITSTPGLSPTPTSTLTPTPTLTPDTQCVQYNVSNTSEGPTTVTFVDCNYVTRNLVVQTGIFGQDIKICARAVLNQGATTWTETSEECPTLTVLVNYSLSGETDVCSEWSADTGNLMYYMSTGYTGLEDGAVIYTDSNLTNLAPDGFYSGYALNGEPQPNLQ
jgi:surface protein